MLKFICYPRCTTCQKAQKFLDEKGVKYELINIKEQNPTEDELKEYLRLSGLPLKRFFNTSGLLYKSLNLREKLPEMSQSEQISLLATDGMLVKRPILVTNSAVLVGFKQEKWENLLK